MSTLVLDRNSYINNNIAFGSLRLGSGIPRARRKEITKFVKDFISESEIPKDKFTRIRNKIGRIGHPLAGIGYSTCRLAEFFNGDFLSGGKALLAGFITHDYEKLFHNIALIKVKYLTKELIKKGFSEQERILAIKKYLNRDGALIYSKFFNLTSPKEIKKLANGQEIKKKKGLMPYLLDCMDPRKQTKSLQ